jgi:hypothetical protein
MTKLSMAYLSDVLEQILIPEKNSVYDKCLYGLYEEAPVIRARVEYILARFDMPNDVREQLEDIRDN